jgi:inorganic pyrophosphatase
LQSKTDMTHSIRVLIENEAGSLIKNTYDENTLRFVRGAPVSRPYPFAYGFVLNTRAADGAALDCFVLSENPLLTGEQVSCYPKGLLEQIEDGEIDHKVIAIIDTTSSIPDGTRETIAEFAEEVFVHVPGKRMQVGRLLGPAEAWAHIQACRLPNP